MSAKKVVLELVGIDGNAFAIMGAFERNARRQGWTKEEINAVLKEAKSGDYDHLLATIIANTESPAEDDPKDEME
jgi:hypothetical protein